MDTGKIPHGHGKSFKLGIVDSLLAEKNYEGEYMPNDLPHGHNKSYQRGRTEGDGLRKSIAERVKI